MTGTLNRQPGDFRAEFALPAFAGGVGVARRIARELLVAWGLDLDHPAIDALIISLSELITNVHKHARLARLIADVTLSCSGDLVSVGVHDRDPRRPRLLPAAHPNACSGRGLRLVSTLAADVGGRVGVVMDSDGHGKTVRVELPLSVRINGLAGETPAASASGAMEEL
jgi:two-component sensor histidine kinase